MDNAEIEVPYEVWSLASHNRLSAPVPIWTRRNGRVRRRVRTTCHNRLSAPVPIWTFIGALKKEDRAAVLSQSPIGSGPDMDRRLHRRPEEGGPLCVTIAYRLRSRYGQLRHLAELLPQGATSQSPIGSGPDMDVRDYLYALKLVSDIESQSPIGSGPDMDLRMEFRRRVLPYLHSHNRLSDPVPIWTGDELESALLQGRKSQSPIGSGPDMDRQSASSGPSSRTSHNRLSAPVPIWTALCLSAYLLPDDGRSQSPIGSGPDMDELIKKLTGATKVSISHNRLSAPVPIWTWRTSSKELGGCVLDSHNRLSAPVPIWTGSDREDEIILEVTPSQSPIGSGPDMDLALPGTLSNPGLAGHNRLSAPVPIWTGSNLSAPLPHLKLMSSQSPIGSGPDMDMN